jgi:hemolysin activation/secretion protein
MSTNPGRDRRRAAIAAPPARCALAAWRALYLIGVLSTLAEVTLAQAAADRAAPSTAPSASASPPAPASGASPGRADPTEPRFDITRFELEGATLVDPASLERALAPHTGAGRRFGDIESALDAVIAAYQRTGITAVQVYIPEQTLEGGVVRLKVEEMRVSRVEADGAKLAHLQRLRRAVPSLLEGRTPVDTTLAQELRLANENPSRRMEVTFRTEADDTLTGVLRVAERGPLAGLLTLDNTGSASTGRARLGLALQHANLLDHDIVGTAQWQTSPGRDRQVRVGSVGLRLPWYRAGVMVDVSASGSSVDAGTLRTLAGDYFVASRGRQTGLRVTRLLPRWGTVEPRVSIGIDRRHVDSQVTTGPGGASLVPDIVLRPLTLSHALTWATPQRSVQAQVSLSHNLPAGGRSAPEVFAEPGLRADANPRYTVLRADVSATWLRGPVSVLLGWSGQWTRDALVPAEQFSAGGPGSVRGIEGRLATGDHGQRLGLEVQGPLPETTHGPGWRLGWQVFADAAWLGRNRAQPGDKGWTRLSGIGAGLRADWQGGLGLRADAATVTDGGGVAPTRSGFLHLAATYGF